MVPVSRVLPTMRLTDSAGLDARAVLAVARGELVPELGDDLIGWLDGRRARMLAALDAGDPVYGVTTCMGAMSEVGLDQDARARQSEALLTARAVGGPPWLGPAETRAVLAIRLREVLEDHPGIAAMLKTRDPLGPHSLALAEALLTALRASGLPQQQTALAFWLVYDYTTGFAVSDRTTDNEQRVHDPATRLQLHEFFRSLPATSFPVLAILGEQVWADNRDQRFRAGLDTILAGLQVPAVTPP